MMYATASVPPTWLACAHACRPAELHTLGVSPPLQVVINDAREDLRRAKDCGGRTAGQELEAARVSKQWLERYLTPENILALARLSVFRGSFDANGAAALQILGGAQPSNTADAVNAAVLQLRNLSLLQPAQSAAAPGALPRYAMHKLVRGIAAELLVQLSRDSGAADAASSLLSHVRMLFVDWMLQLGGQLDGLFNHPGSDSLQRAQSLLANEELNFQHLLTLLDDEHVQANMADRLGGLATLALALKERGKLQLAHALCSQQLELTLRAPGPDHPTAGASYDSLGCVLMEQGKLAEAEQAHREALRISLQMLGTDHASTGASYNHLGLALMWQGQLAEAEQAHREALRIKLQALGPDNTSTGRSHDSLGLLLMEQGQLAEAEQAHREALRIMLQELGPDHTSTGRSRDSLGLVLREQGKLAEAEQEHREALRIMLQALGPDHFSTGDSSNNLGLVLMEQGKLAEAEQAHREALRIKEQALGLGHPSTMRSCSDLSAVLRR
jgi:tetratricopeptide (TPR) repeat protein